MFKLEIYSTRSFSAIPPFQGPSRRTERLAAGPGTDGGLQAHRSGISVEVIGRGPRCGALHEDHTDLMQGSFA